MTGDSAVDAELFLTKWRRARYLLYREGIASTMTAQELGERLFKMRVGACDIHLVCAPLRSSEIRQKNDFLEYRVPRTPRHTNGDQ